MLIGRQRQTWIAVLLGFLGSEARAQWTVVDLHPAGATQSFAYGVQGGQEAGQVDSHAALWTGNAASWVDLNPPTATSSQAWGAGGGQEVGAARINGVTHAIVWSG